MKNYLEKRGITKDRFIQVATSSPTAAEACRILGLRYTTYRSYAKQFDCFYTNQGGKGTSKNMPAKVDYEEMLRGEKRYYLSCNRALKSYLFSHGLKTDECERSGWKGKLPGKEFTQCELHHKDGDNSNQALSNLEIICPNCHSLTETYRGANMSRKIERSARNG